MNIKIITLVTTRYDYDIAPAVEEKIIGVVNADEDITDLVDLYHEKYRMTWDSPVTPEEYKDMCEEEIRTEIVKVSTVKELIIARQDTMEDYEFGAGEEYCNEPNDVLPPGYEEWKKEKKD